MKTKQFFITIAIICIVSLFSTNSVFGHPWLSPYSYCNNNPVNRVDPDGKWDITVHVYKDRAEYGYGTAVVTDRKGNEVMQYDVRAEGVGGHDRNVENADTPLGVYDIPANDTWRASTNNNRKSYGPNDRLVMTPESGEIVDTGRGDIRMHGGRQETHNTETNTWSADANPSLEKTKGCLRAFDTDMASLKTTTTNLQTNDKQESPGKVTVVNDLQKQIVPASSTNLVEVKTVYVVPTAPTFPTFTQFNSTQFKW